MNIYLTLIAAAALGSTEMVDAFSKVEYNAGALLNEQEERELMSFTVIFEECLHQPEQVCKDLINAALAENPAIFAPFTSFNFNVNKVREESDTGYYKVGVRTDMTSSHAVGILGDGMIFYPYDWCVAENLCYEIGPWDCDVGLPLTWEGCCDMIKDSVPDPDVNGNMIDCYPSHPVGSLKNPIDYQRITIVVNSDGIVIRPPRNE